MSTAHPPVYDALLRLKPEDVTLGGWAKRAGVSRSVFNEIREHGNPKRATLEKLLGAAGASFAEFETDLPVRSEVRATGAVGGEVRDTFFGSEALPPLPLYGSAIGGECQDLEEQIELTEMHLTEVLDYLTRPASLAGDREAYALTIVGDSMVPRFRPGERVVVSPRAPLAIGDDVIVQLRGEDCEEERVRLVLIKELVRRNGSHIELRQHNPATTFKVPLKRVAAMHKVKGNFF